MDTGSRQRRLRGFPPVAPATEHPVFEKHAQNGARRKTVSALLEGVRRALLRSWGDFEAKAIVIS